MSAAIRTRAAPFFGFCGGAQLLALLEAQDRVPAEDDLGVVDRVLHRNDGSLIRGFASPADVVRAWPTDPHPLRSKVEFAQNDPLFSDLAGPARRSATFAFPELHSDAVRDDAFLPGAPLERFEMVATSRFCRDGGSGDCAVVPEAFRARGGGWPIIGAQFHPEQRDFSSPAPDDPPESVADPYLFLAAAYESFVDAYVRRAL